MQPGEKEIAAMKHQRDSVEMVQRHAIDSIRKSQEQQQQQAAVKDSLMPDDSTRAENMRQQLDVFAPAGEGKEEFVTLENDLMKINFSTRGGKIHSAELKNYKDYTG